MDVVDIILAIQKATGNEVTLVLALDGPLADKWIAQVGFRPNVTTETGASAEDALLNLAHHLAGQAQVDHDRHQEWAEQADRRIEILSAVSRPTSRKAGQ